MDKYLIQLLKEVNTIIIPGIGALTIVNQVTGEVMFLSFMKFDDEKLATYIAEKEGWSLNDAKNLVAKYVRDINAKLAIGDTYDMYQFGSFSKNKEGEIEFTSWEGKKSTQSEDSESAGIALDENTTSAVEEVVSEIDVIESTNEKIEVKEDFSFELDADNISETAQSEVESVTDEPISIELENLDFNLDKESDIENNEEIEASAASISKDSKKDVKEADTKEKKPKKTKKPVKKVAAKVTEKSIKKESSKKEKIAEIVEKVKETPVIEKVVEVVKEATPVAPIMLSVEEQLNDDLDVAPINEIKPIVIKPILEKTISDEKRKKRRVPVFLWILLGLLIGGGIYTAINYDNLKQHIPFLADNSSRETKKTEKNIIEKESSGDEVGNSNSSETENNLDPVETNSANTETEIETATPIAEVAPVTPPSNSGFTVNKALPYQVIVGSFSEKSNADRKVKSLKSEGFSPEIIGQYDGLYFVSLGSFNSMSEVKAKASKISEVGSYWVFKK